MSIKAINMTEESISTAAFIEERLEEALSYDQKPKKTQGKRLYPSALGNPCDRFLWLDYHNMIPGGHISANTERIFDAGRKAEIRYNEYFKRAGFSPVREIPLKQHLGGVLISGRADFRLNVNGEKYLIELKTINANGFKKLTAPKPEHATQLQLYLWMSGIDKGSVFYECKDDLKIKLFELHRSEGFITTLGARIQKVLSWKKPPTLKEVQTQHSVWCACREVKDSEIA